MRSIYDIIVAEEGAYKVETIGDSFMVVGGAPEAEGAVEAAQRVAAVALRMMAETEALHLGHQLSIRIGIHSGPVVAAVVGHSMPR